MSEGKKYDAGKPLVSLLPWEALYEIAKVLTYGKMKYAAHNWRGGMDWSRITDAMQRHFIKYSMGLDHDKESGLLHTAHIACNALFLLAYQILGLGNDDRWKIPPEMAQKWEEEFDQLTAEQARLWEEALQKIKNSSKT